MTDAPDPADRPGTGAEPAERSIPWRELLAETEVLVGDRRHARWICERATSTSPDEFRSLLDTPATERAVHHLDAMVARARAGEPIQYVLGAWPFRRLDLLVDRRVLIPRPETEDMAGYAVELLADLDTARTVLDLGTGSGAIGLALADELPQRGTVVWLTDVSEDALAVARANLAGLGRAAANVRLAAGSWYDAVPTDVRFDLVVANPPYVAADDPELDASVAEWEPSSALLSGADGLDDLRIVVAGAPERLATGGRLLVEHGRTQGAAVRNLFAEAGFVEVATLTDAAGHDRMTVGRRSDAVRSVAAPDEPRAVS